uniref:Condensation domain-containing protein n=1 Tax=Globisporangium ultimum (strain ATCC 200006 / CBS 805.95 / DAOM BR144) TaxID=431595 RepID=K3WXC6_GLOUD
MVQVPPFAVKEKIPLHGFERFMSIADNGSAVIATPMLLQGSHAGATDALVAGLEVAVLRTFNKHPRMRTKQIKGEFALAEIHPLLAIENVRAEKLLEVRVVDNSDEFRNTWSEYVEAQCNIAFNRYAQFPYYVRVWHCPALNQARVMLFADHYMSDGMSGIFVLNDIVSIASKLAREKLQDLAPADQVANPLRPSLYDQWLRPQGRVRLWFSTLLIKMFGKMVYKHELKHFSPIIPARADQADFVIPPKVNTSSAFFASGNQANMVAALQRCKEEGVTFFGAISAAIVIAYYLISDSKNKNNAKEPFKFNLGLDYNMRKRVESP